MGGHLLWAEALPLGSSLLHSSVVPRGLQEQLEYPKARWHPAPSLHEHPGISLTPPVPDSTGTAPDRTPQRTPCACEGQFRGQGSLLPGTHLLVPREAPITSLTQSSFAWCCLVLSSRKRGKEGHVGKQGLPWKCL